MFDHIENGEQTMRKILRAPTISAATLTAAVALGACLRHPQRAPTSFAA